mgnify:CR=1 FL=1
MEWLIGDGISIDFQYCQVYASRMSLSHEDVKRLADLARLDLNETEMVVMQNDLVSILGFVDRLQKIDTTDVPPLTMPATGEWREDVSVPCDNTAREIILSNFPFRKGDLLGTPGVFEKPKGSSAVR